MTRCSPHTRAIQGAAAYDAASGRLLNRGAVLWSAVTGLIKLALPAGKANPAPPVGPALGAKVCCALPVPLALFPCLRAPQGSTTAAAGAAQAEAQALSEQRARQGVNIMAFCKEYNAATQDKVGTIIPVEITVYEVRGISAALAAPRPLHRCPEVSGVCPCRAGPELHLHPEDAARVGAAAEGGRHREGLGHAQLGEGRQRHAGAD